MIRKYNPLGNKTKHVFYYYDLDFDNKPITVFQKGDFSTLVTDMDYDL